MQTVTMSPQGATRHQRIIDRAKSDISKAPAAVLAGLMRDNLAEVRASAAQVSPAMMADLEAQWAQINLNDDNAMAAVFKSELMTTLNDEDVSPLQRSAFAARVIANLLVG